MKNPVKRRSFCLVFMVTAIASAQLVIDPLPYAPIANPLPDTMDHQRRDSVNLKISRIRINQAGYRPQDEKLFYCVGSGSNFSIINNETGATVGNGTLTSTGQSTSGKLDITCYQKASIIAGGGIKYHLESPTVSGIVMKGLIPDLPKGTYKIKVGNDESPPFYIGEDVYSMVKDALLKYYGVARCGDNDSWFHADCHLKDAVVGGWHDAGDHLKVPQSIGYAFSILALCAAALHDRDHDVYGKNQANTVITDGIPDVLIEAKVGADYIVRSYTQGGQSVTGMKIEIGEFGMDHNWWHRPENQDFAKQVRGGPPRPNSFGLGGNTAGSISAGMALFGKMWEPYDAAYAAICIKIAEELYAWGKNHQEAVYCAAMNGGGRTNDELALAALGLWWATKMPLYKNDLLYNKSIGTHAAPATYPRGGFSGGWMTALQAGLFKDMANSDWDNLDTYVLWGLYRLILMDEATALSYEIDAQERLNLIEDVLYCMIANIGEVGLSQGNDIQTITLPAHGFQWKQNTLKCSGLWGWMHTQQDWMPNRYQSGNITDLFCYYDIASKVQGVELPNAPASTDWKAGEVLKVLIKQFNYMLGINPWDVSMIVGVGDKNLNHPHHRASNPEMVNVPGNFYQYIPPVGALSAGYLPTISEYLEFMGGNSNPWLHSEVSIDATTSIFLPAMGLAKEDTIGPPEATVRIVYVGCDEAIIEIRQSRLGTSEIHYGTTSGTYKNQRSDSTDVFHRITLGNLTNGTTYYFNVTVSDLFGRDTLIKYLDEEKKLVDFSFTTLQNCPNDAQIANVKICRVTHDSAEIFWYTPNGEFDSKVVYGTAKPPTTVKDGDVAGHPVKFHYVKIGGLKEKTTYYFYVQSGESVDDNQGQLYTFTTPVMHVEFDVRAVRYDLNGMQYIGLNILNQEARPYDSLEVRIYFRDKEGFEDDIIGALDILNRYESAGFQEPIEGPLNQEIKMHLRNQVVTKIPDTYDPADGTYAYFLTVPFWGVEMRSQSRLRIDIALKMRQPDNLKDESNFPMKHEITARDWSFGSHSKANGDPIDFPGIPVVTTKNDVDDRYHETPINHYITVYRKGEYIWGYSPSQAELSTKKNYYTIESQIISPLHNPSEDYVFYERPIRSVDVSGWAIVSPVDGTLNEIWINGVKQTNPQSLFRWSDAENRYDFTVPVPVQNGRNNVDVTLFAGPPIACVDCYGCAVSNHHFFIEFQGAKQFPSVLVMRDEAWQPMSDTVKLDTTKFHVIVTDPNGNQNGKATDVVKVWIKNYDNGDSIEVTLFETGGDSTGVFQTMEPIAVVDRTPAESGKAEIAMNGGDRVRVWYVDPTDSTDSSEAFITSKANFPLARRGWLTDSDGDGAVDRMVVEYSIPLKENVDSILVNFPNAMAPTMARAGVDEMTFTANVVTVRFAKPFPSGITGFTSALYTSGTSYLTSTGLVKASNFQVYDSIGPVLNNEAIVRERLEAGNDTITITLSESIKLDNFKGEVLMLRRGGKDSPIKVLGIVSSEPGSYTMTVICDAGGMQFASGDSLRLNGASTLADLSGNRPHLNNRSVPVVIKAGLPRIVYAYYLDTDFNGKIDLVRMGFSKEVVPELLNISLRWKINTPVVLAGSRVSLIPGSSTDIAIAVDSILTNNDVITSGFMRSAVVQTKFPLDTVSYDVADSAAPVIVSARFSLYNGDITRGDFVDTLRIVFSEPIMPDSVEKIEAFNLQRVNGDMPQNYTFNISVTATDSGYRYVREIEYVFLGRTNVVDYPNTGDLIRLQPESKVTDSRGNVQTSDDNRQVPVIVDEVTFSLDKYSGPNPFNPTIETFILKIKPQESRFPFQLDSSACAIIYDKVGNVVTEISSTQETAGIRLQWNGTNKKGRIVGNGTYLLYFSFKGEKERRIVGVMRK